MNIKYAAVQVLDVMSGIIDIVEAHGCKDEEDIRPWLSERLAAYASQKAEIERLRAAAEKTVTVLTKFRADGEIDMSEINRAERALTAALAAR